MFNLAFASGKGGAGKTSISVSFYKYLQNFYKDICFVDCDVDAANSYILIENKILKKEKFFAGFKYKINEKTCNNCGLCAENCNFNAIKKEKNNYFIKLYNCEGCGFCKTICPSNAIDQYNNYCGDKFITKTENNKDFFYAKLHPGEDNSGKLVQEIKNEAYKIAKENALIIIDSPPGIGCPTISALTGIDYLIIVLESSISGYKDALKLIKLAEIKKIGYSIILNKTGLNKKLDIKIKKKMKRKKIKVLGKIPFSIEFIKALNNKEDILNIENENIKYKIFDIYDNLRCELERRLK